MIICLSETGEVRLSLKVPVTNRLGNEVHANVPMESVFLVKLDQRILSDNRPVMLFCPDCVL